MSVPDLLDPIEAEAAGRRARAQTIEGLGHALALFGGYPGAIVLNVKRRSDAQDGDVATAMLGSVLDEVHQHAFHGSRIAAACLRVIDDHLDPPVRGDQQRCQIADDTPHQRGPVQILVVPADIEPCGSSSCSANVADR